MATNQNALNNTLAATALTGTLQAGQFPALTGAVTTSAGSLTTAIAPGVIVNADVNASAAIAVSKLAALTASRAAVTDGSGFLAAAATTATEIGYVNGVTSAIQAQIDGKQAAGNYITALTGDVTASGPGSVAAALATVNADVGSFGSSTSIPSFTVNAKGLITAASGNAVVAPAGTLSGNTLAAGVTASSLTSVGVLTSGTASTGFVVGGVTVTVGSDATGDIYYRNAGGVLTRLGIGSGGDVLTVAAGLPSWASPGGISDGNKGDVTVSSGGATWTINGGAVTFAKMQAVSANVLLGNDASGTTVEEIPCTAAGRNLLDDADASAQRTTLGLAIGADVQAYDADLQALASNGTNGMWARTGAGTGAARTLTGGGGVTVSNGDGVSGNPTLGVSALQTAWIPAAAIRPSSSGGCADLSLAATGANQPDISGLAFDPDAIEYAQFGVRFPKGWDEGTIKATFYWTANSTSTNSAVWALQGVAVSDNDAIGTSYGTAQSVTDANGSSAYTLRTTSATSAITIAGTPAAGDEVFFRVYRDATNGSDNLAVDAILLGVTLFYTINTLDDA